MISPRPYAIVNGYQKNEASTLVVLSFNMKGYTVLSAIYAVALQLSNRGICIYIFLLFKITFRLDRINQSLQPYTGWIE